jgi:hypothetical protein
MRVTNPNCSYCGRRGILIYPVRYAIACPNGQADLPGLQDNFKVVGGPIDVAPAKYVLRALRTGYLYTYEEKRKRLKAYIVLPRGALWEFPIEYEPVVEPEFMNGCCQDMVSVSLSYCIDIEILPCEMMGNIWVGWSNVVWTKSTVAKASNPDWRKKHMQCIDAQEMLSGIDMDGNVEKAVTIGRDWEGVDGLEELLAQWNYWCWFMNKGPAELPKPGLFLPEDESMHESFLYCVYELGFNASPAFRIMFLPVFLLLASHRIMALWTCSPPKWPVAILEKCKIDPDDPFDEPKGSTPVGWHATGLAREQGTYPELQSKKIDDWKSEPDGHKNSLLWAEDELKPDIRSAQAYNSQIS